MAKLEEIVKVAELSNKDRCVSYDKQLRRILRKEAKKRAARPPLGVRKWRSR